MLTNDQQIALAEAVVAAKEAERTTRCPKDLTVAQWALETGWGSRQPSNNCFGIKSYEGCYGTQCVQTWEVVNGKRQDVTLLFATFPTLIDCFEKHGFLITEEMPYQKPWKQYQLDGKLEPFIRAVSAVYATDPAYADKLLRILAMPEVTAALGQ